MSDRPIASPHDIFFKKSLQQKKIAHDFLKHHLPVEIQSRIDWNTLQNSDREFVTFDDRRLHIDVVYQCKIDHNDAYIYAIIEHQSSDDTLMAFRMFEYTIALMRSHLSQGYKKLPIVVPLCVYHGERSPYPHSTDIYDCFEDIDLAKTVVFHPFRLLDLTVALDEELKGHGHAALVERLIKHIREKDFYTTLKKLIENELFSKMSDLDKFYINHIMSYILNTVDDRRINSDELVDLMTKALPNKRKEIMTLADQLRQEGHQKGHQKGLKEGLKEGRQEGYQEKAIEIAKNSLELNIPIDQIKKLTGLSEEALEKLKKEQSH